MPQLGAFVARLEELLTANARATRRHFSSLLGRRAARGGAPRRWAARPRCPQPQPPHPLLQTCPFVCSSRFLLRQCRVHRNQVQLIGTIAAHGRMNWQKSSGYNLRARVEASIGRYKRVIGTALRSRTDETEATPSRRPPSTECSNWDARATPGLFETPDAEASSCRQASVQHSSPGEFVSRSAKSRSENYRNQRRRDRSRNLRANFGRSTVPGTSSLHFGRDRQLERQPPKSAG